MEPFEELRHSDTKSFYRTAEFWRPIAVNVTSGILIVLVYYLLVRVGGIKWVAKGAAVAP